MISVSIAISGSGEADRREAEATRTALIWVRRFLADLSVIRSGNTVRAYEADLHRWIKFCDEQGTDPSTRGRRMAIAFVRAERERVCRGEQTVSPRSIVRRLAAIRQWYSYLALEPEQTGVQRNPIPVGNAVRTGSGIITGKPALLRYDHPLPQVLSAEEIDSFVEHLDATQYRDTAIAWLLKDGGLRINEALQLRLSEVSWGQRILTIRAAKNKHERRVPISQDALAALSNYVRLERPKMLSHDVVFVNLGWRGFGQPFRYRSWVYICERARAAAGTPSNVSSRHGWTAAKNASQIAGSR
jgi:site-specific recombinase XerD